LLTKTATKTGAKSTSSEKNIWVEPERERVDQGNENEPEIKASLVMSGESTSWCRAAEVQHSLAMLRKIEF